MTTTTSTTKPRYTHDCSACVFLGHYDTEEGEFDLYACTARQVGGDDSFIARYGDEGPEYASAPSSIASRPGFSIAPVVEAYRRWLRLDLIDTTLRVLDNLRDQLRAQLVEGKIDPCDLLGQMDAEAARLARMRSGSDLDA